MRQTAEAFFHAYASGDVDAMLALCAPEATFDYTPYGEQGRGSVARDAAPLWRSYIEAFEGFRPEIVDLWEDSARRTVIVATVNRGLHVKDVAGIVAQRRELAAPHLFLLAFNAEGKIVKITAYFDMMTIFSQIGFPQGFAAG